MYMGVIFKKRELFRSIKAMVLYALFYIKYRYFHIWFQYNIFTYSCIKGIIII